MHVMLKMSAMPVLAAALAACSGGGDAPKAPEGASAEAQAAFTALLECASTTASAYSQIGGETMSAEGADKDALTAQEAELRTRKNDLQARMNAAGAALGLTPQEIEEQFNTHIGQFVHGPDKGTRLEYARAVAAQSDSCAAALPATTG